MKYHLATDGPEFRRDDSLELNGVLVLIHFQEVDHFANEGLWSPGFAKGFERMLEGLPPDRVHRSCRRVLGECER